MTYIPGAVDADQCHNLLLRFTQAVFIEHKEALKNKPKAFKSVFWAYAGETKAQENKPKPFKWTLWAYGCRKEASKNKPQTFKWVVWAYDGHKDHRAVQCDVALVPVGGTYTMDVKKAAELVNTIKPQVAIPVHYGTVVGKPSDGETFAKNVKEPVKVELKIGF